MGIMLGSGAKRKYTRSERVGSISNRVSHPVFLCHDVKQRPGGMREQEVVTGRTP